MIRRGKEEGDAECMVGIGGVETYNDIQDSFSCACVIGIDVL